jgi:hypothetical protein
VRDGGAVARDIIARVRKTESELTAASSADLQAIAKHLAVAATALDKVVAYVVANIQSDIKGVFAGSVPYLKLAGIVFGGWQMARAALVAQQKLDAKQGDAKFYSAKIATARFFADHYLSQAGAYRSAIVDGSSGILALHEDQF